ncbi:NAD(P)-dependent oxidoreductase [Lacisediminihabitans sp.]|uniref:NAD(P)-dependent oxidoreductase n=1 Tax=Lacisediminihabitans sp. TaxID=2787631 RepID=UPI00374DD2B8
MAVSVGVLGVGRMGLPIVSRLVDHGFRVSAFDTRQDIAGAVREAGAGWPDSGKRLAGSVDVLVTVLPGRRELEAALGGPHGLLRSMTAGSLWLDLTSGDPALTRELAGEAAGLGIGAVAAPMGGGPAEAAHGRLTFFAAGPDRDVLRVLPLLGALARADGVERAGDRAEDGQTVKLLANLLWFGQAVVVTEALLLGQSLGVTPATLRDILPRTAGGSRFITEHLDLLLSGDYAESFGLDRCVEELETVTGLAADAGTPFEASELVTRLHREALERFGPVPGELLVARLLEERAGRELRAP